MIVNEGLVAAALPGYELGAQLGAGAFGLVLAGRHRGLNRPVAIKILAADHDGATAGFAAEAQLLAALDHPHVVRVHDYVEAGDLHLLVMELLGGGTLTARRKTGISPEGACAVGLAAAAALACAHARGVLHRDIKPDNMLFDTAGLLKVTDFGTAKIMEGSAATASQIAGTAAYMAPEQILAARLGPATDLYALGCVLYRLLTGKSPFNPALPLHALWQHHLNTLPPPPAGVPTPVADVVMRALAKNPADRQPSARAFALDLAAAAARAYGPGWTARAGIGLRLDDDIRAATDHLPQPIPAALPATIRMPPPPTAPPDIPWGGQPDDHRLWRPLGEPLTSPKGRALRSMNAVVFAPDGTIMAGGGDDKTVRLWDVTDRMAPRPLGGPLTGHTGMVRSVGFHPNGRTLASASHDKTVRLWDITDRIAPRPLGQPLTGHTDWVNAVGFAPDSRTLASASRDRTMRLWAPH